MGIKIKVDKVGRLVNPKQFREEYNIKEGSKFELKCNDDLKLILVKDGDKR